MESEKLQKKILRELSYIAFADATAVVGTDENGNLRIRDTDGLSAALRRSIAGIKVGAKGVEVKFYDKLRALEILGKLLREDEIPEDDHMTVTLRVIE